MELEHLPDLAPFLRSSRLRTVATYGVCGVGGVLAGSLVGGVIGEVRQGNLEVYGGYTEEERRQMSWMGRGRERRRRVVGMARGEEVVEDPTMVTSTHIVCLWYVDGRLMF